MTIREESERTTRRLAAAGIRCAEADAEWILADLFGVNRAALVLGGGEPFPENLREELDRRVGQRAARRPLQHILGTAPFLDWNLRVSGDVLVPRPETEQLALRAVALARSAGVPPEKLVVLDVGTGSGCLAIALAAGLPGARVRAVDVSPAALAIARGNAADCGVPDIRFSELDLLVAAEDEFAGLDLIVSNPPYIPSAEIAELEPEVRDHDPRTALDGGADGLVFHRKLATLGRAWLRAGGRIVVEFGDGQGPSLSALFKDAGWEQIVMEPDLGGRERFLLACSPREERITRAA